MSEKCEKCNRELANTKFTIGGNLILCPICWLGPKEGGQQKYWETSKAKNAGTPEGFRYEDDTAKYKDKWDKDKKKWVNLVAPT